MGISLTKWISNSRKVIESAPTSERAVSDKDYLVDQLSWSPRALGARCNAETDIYGFKIYLRDKSFTRRGVLFIVSSIYEAEGFAAPFIFPAKRLQNLSRRGLGWDVIVSDLVELSRRSPKAGVTHILSMIQANSICQVHQFANESHIAWGRVFSTDAERVQALS